jgi:hypothetical protein
MSVWDEALAALLLPSPYQIVQQQEQQWYPEETSSDPRV